ncbi:MAG: lytic transglycosylase domain-containing protein [Candidatus Melainabacteria bacterium]
MVKISERCPRVVSVALAHQHAGPVSFRRLCVGYIGVGLALAAYVLLSLLSPAHAASGDPQVSAANWASPEDVASPLRLTPHSQLSHPPVNYLASESSGGALPPYREVATVNVDVPGESAKSGGTVSNRGNSSQYASQVRQNRGFTTAPADPMDSLQPVDPLSVPVYGYTTDSLARFIQRYNKKLAWEEASGIARAILSASRYYKVDARLMTSLFAVESSFRTDAISSSGAIGLGQLKPDTARWLGVNNPYDPIDNALGSTRYVAWLAQRYNGSWDHALSAYFQGQGTIDRNGITNACIPYLTKINAVLQTL